MFAAMQALVAQQGRSFRSILYFLFTIEEEVGVGASNILTEDVASLIAVDNGTSAPGQNSAEFGVTISMADRNGPFDYHLTRKLVEARVENEIPLSEGHVPLLSVGRRLGGRGRTRRAHGLDHVLASTRHMARSAFTCMPCARWLN